MTKYRNRLPQLDGGLFLTDGGLETTLIFEDGVDLPWFAAYPLLNHAEGLSTLGAYYSRYIHIARAQGVGFVLGAPTWRANPDWGERLGDNAEELEIANRRAVALLKDLRDTCETSQTPIVVSGDIGPRQDAYRPQRPTSADEAEDYHGPQVRLFADAGVDMIACMTMPGPAEVIGIARAARAAETPLAVSFTVETDGRLPSGQSLEEAIGEVDEATGRWPAYYMVNCAHPTHFADVIEAGGAWVKRIGGVRGNASRLSHAELDEATELDAGDPDEFGRLQAELFARHRNICVLGGCCGTDHRHVEAIGRWCSELA